MYRSRHYLGSRSDIEGQYKVREMTVISDVALQHWCWTQKNRSSLQTCLLPSVATMHSLLFLTAGASILHHATASFTGNLNYHSPSRRDEHANLGLHVDHISRRSMKRGNIAYSSSELSFTHGIASGDPYPDSVILWTRIAPSTESDQSNVTVEGTVPVYNHDTETYIEADANPICVDWAVWRQTSENGTDTNGTYTGPVVSSGTAYTTSDIDYTVKVSRGGELKCHLTQS